MSDTERQRAEVLESIFGNTIFDENKNEVYVFCPKHSHKKRKLQINVRNNKFHCWVCGYSGGSIFFLLREYANKSQRKKYLSTIGDFASKNEDKSLSLLLPDEYRPIFPSNTIASRACYSYLKSHEISDETLIQTKVGFCRDGKYSQRIIFPSFDSCGNLNFFSTRTYNENFYLKYFDCEIRKSSIVFNDLYYDYSKPIILVENIKAHLRHFFMRNVVPILGSSINNESEVLKSIIYNGCEEVVLALDPDSQKSVLRISKLLQSYGIVVRICNVDKQPDQIDSSRFKSLIENSKPINSIDLLRFNLGAIS